MESAQSLAGQWPASRLALGQSLHVRDLALPPGVTVLDPNPLMTDLVLREGGAKRYPETKVTVEVVSKTPITPEVRDALGRGSSAIMRISLPRTRAPIGW